MWHIWERGEVYAVFWWGYLGKETACKTPCIDGKIILRRIFRKRNVGAWTELSWLRIGTGGGH